MGGGAMIRHALKGGRLARGSGRGGPGTGATGRVSTNSMIG